MPDSVKISDLTPRSAATDDVLPAVDGTFNSTVRVTAASIAAIGGGPPGDGTVTTTKIVNNNVTLAKIQQLQAYRLIANNTNATATPQDVAFTPYGMSLLQAANSTAARQLINDSNTFTGEVLFDDGTEGNPSINNKNITDPPSPASPIGTGIYWPSRTSLGITTEGKLRFMVDGDGQQYSTIDEQSSVVRPQFSCRAWVAFNGASSTTTTIRSQSTIAQRYGRDSSLFLDGWTDTSGGAKTSGTATGLTTTEVARLEDVNNGNTVVFMGAAAADGRTNYTSPSDNYHWRYTGSAWTKLGPPLQAGQSWIGELRFKPKNNQAFGILAHGGVSSVALTANAGEYVINFKEQMPDANYCVVTGSKRTGWSSVGGDDVVSRTFTSVTIRHYENAQPTASSYLAVSIFR